MSTKILLFIFALVGLIHATPTPQTNADDNAGTSFTLTAVSDDPTIDGIPMTTTGSGVFLNYTNLNAATFYQNDTTHLYILSNVADAPIFVGYNPYYVYNDGFTGWGAIYEPGLVIQGNFTASDGYMYFNPENNNGTALQGWWACPYTTSTGNYYTIANGANAFDGSLDFGYGPDYCTEITVKIATI